MGCEKVVDFICSWDSIFGLFDTISLASVSTVFGARSRMHRKALGISCNSQYLAFDA